MMNTTMPKKVNAQQTSQSCEDYHMTSHKRNAFRLAYVFDKP